MSDPEKYLFDPPQDPDDHPRAVWIDRMIQTAKRTQWLRGLFLKAPAVAAALIVLWQAILFVAERLPK